MIEQHTATQHTRTEPTSTPVSTPRTWSRQWPVEQRLPTRSELRAEIRANRPLRRLANRLLGRRVPRSAGPAGDSQGPAVRRDPAERMFDDQLGRQLVGPQAGCS
ncbi:MAG TPA: hypothetical protein VH141_22205 [Pseudonocardia sp.]|jgi:hypothetical protein|nr:hypothetical protein [Pseudonocardia sp.]